jgi:hypothetical protein
MRYQPQGLTKLASQWTNKGLSFLYLASAGDSTSDLISGVRGAASGVSGGITEKGKSLDFANSAGQGVVFGGQSPFAGTQQTVLVVARAQARSSQRNVLLSARSPVGPFIGVNFNADANLAIVSGAFSFGWALEPTSGGNGLGGYIPNAITGRTSCYVISRNGPVLSGAVDGQIKTVATQSPNAKDLTRNDLQVKIGDLGGFSGSGYGSQDPVLMVAVFNTSLSDEEIIQLSRNPWQVFDSEDPWDDIATDLPGINGSLIAGIGAFTSASAGNVAQYGAESVQLQPIGVTQSAAIPNFAQSIASLAPIGLVGQSVSSAIGGAVIQLEQASLSSRGGPSVHGGLVALIGNVSLSSRGGSGTITPSPARTLTIRADNRAYLIRSENRTLKVVP